MTWHFEDFRVGDEFELGTWKITEQEIVEFASVFDPQPRHTRVGEGVTASGWHVGSIFMRLYVDAVLHRCAAEASPGVERMHWSAPVEPGTPLSGRVRVLDTRPALGRMDAGIVYQYGELTGGYGEPVFKLRFYGMIQRAAAVVSGP